MNTSDDIDYTLADQVAEDIANAFFATERLPAHLRHWLYVPLLGLDGFEPLGHNLQVISERLESLLGAESYEKLSAAGQHLRAFLKDCCNPTYVVANYWSPIDARRRAIVQTSRRDGAELRETLAYAYGFYALTYSGAEQKETPWSAVYYAGIHAPRTRGFAISYNYLSGTGTPHNELYIPAGPERTEHQLPEGGPGLLEELGIEASFRTILLRKRGSAQSK